jgi:hypothetical protein
MKLIDKIMAIASQYNVVINHDAESEQFMTRMVVENKDPTHPYIKDSITWYLFNTPQGLAVTCSLFKYWRSEDESEILDLFRLGCDMMGRIG